MTQHTFGLAKTDLKYIEHVWAATILTAPLVLTLLIGATSGVWHPGLIMVYVFSVFIAVPVSIPAIFLFGLAWKELRYATKKMWILNGVLSLIVFVSLSVTCYFLSVAFDLDFDLEVLILPALLSATLLFYSFYFKPER